MIFTINGLKDEKFMIISKKFFFKLTKFKNFNFSGNLTDLYFCFLKWTGL